MTDKPKRVTQCQRPSGWLGRLILRNMNSRHSQLTDWGLSHVSIENQDTVLDVGCGGGRTVSKLAVLASQGKVFGVDYSKDSVTVATKINHALIETGRVEIWEGSVSRLPFPDNTFDLASAVETHFWWPDLPADMREVFRVLKPAATFILVAEIYKGAKTRTAKLAEKYLPSSGMKLLTVEEHRQLLTATGYLEVQVSMQEGKGWICVIGKKPSIQKNLHDPGKNI